MIEFTKPSITLNSKALVGANSVQRAFIETPDIGGDND